MNYGLVITKSDPTAYVLGAFNELPKEVFQPDGRWGAYLPMYEPQAENYETWGCTIWGSQNCVETLLKRKYGREYNFSERYNYILSGVREPGADPHKSCESLRNDGMIDNSRLPIPETYEEFLQPDPMEPELEIEAHQLPFVVKHQWVLNGDVSPDEQKQMMMSELQYSPLGVAVYAWKKRGDIYIRPNGVYDNHWCMIFGYVEGQYWECFDSYDHSIKHLDWNFGFYHVKRFYIQEKSSVKQDNWLVELIKRFFKVFFKWS